MLVINLRGNLVKYTLIKLILYVSGVKDKNLAEKLTSKSIFKFGVPIATLTLASCVVSSRLQVTFTLPRHNVA